MSADDMNRDLELEVEPKPAASTNSTKSHGESEYDARQLCVSNAEQASLNHTNTTTRKNANLSTSQREYVIHFELRSDHFTFSETPNSKEREAKDHKSTKSSSHEDKDADIKRKRTSDRSSSERPEKVAKTSKDDAPSSSNKDRERDVPKMSSSVKVSVPSSVSIKKESSATKRPREEGALEDGI